MNNHQDWPTCRVCGKGGAVMFATFAMNTDSVRNWYLCDKHANIVIKAVKSGDSGVRQLAHAAEVRKYLRSSFY